MKENQDSILTESLENFARRLASREPVPGGGAAASYIGAMGAALAGMAVAYSDAGNKKRDVEFSDLSGAASRLDAMREELLNLADQDCKAYGAYVSAVKLPRTTPEEKSLRKRKIRSALEGALAVPLRAATLCAEGLERLEILADRLNPSLITDVGASARCFGAALEACWLNVMVNARSMKDPELISELTDRRTRLLAESTERSGRILAIVDKILSGY